jgi:hypothetical protein
MEQVQSQTRQVEIVRQPYQRPVLVNHGKVEQQTQGERSCPSKPIYDV